MENIALLKVQARRLPHSPGVYVMKSETTEILYIGKAKDLYKRVLSYFSHTKDPKTYFLLRRAVTIDFIVTTTEYEALLLENTLIKKHTPQYNITLKDGKSYPVICITTEKYPRVIKTRRIVHDGSVYFGPFPRAHMVDIYLDLIQRLFPLRRCSHMRARSSPCLYFHLHRCAAACAGKTSHEEYLQRVHSIRRLLSGKKESLIDDLRKKMESATQKLEFEKASVLRDTIQSIVELHSEQKITDFNLDARDYVGYAGDDTARVVVILQMRGGNLIGTNVYTLPQSTLENDLSSFVLQHYQSLRTFPKKIFVQKSLEDAQSLEKFFYDKLQVDLQVALPSSAQDARRMHMAINNAWMELRSAQQHDEYSALVQLQEVLKLPKAPQHIEGIDIAHVDGKYPVASLVVCKNGKMRRSQYRKYHIKSLPKGGIDDVASIREVVIRRYTRLKNETQPLPDLILIDGGRPQLNSAIEGLKVLNLPYIPLAALAKKREEIYIPEHDTPLSLSADNPALKILQAVRDESHRFATQFRKKLQHNDITTSALTQIVGVGPQRATKLLQEYPDPSVLKNIPPQILAKSMTIPLPVAKAIKAHFEGGDSTQTGKAASFDR